MFFKSSQKKTIDRMIEEGHPRENIYEYAYKSNPSLLKEMLLGAGGFSLGSLLVGVPSFLLNTGLNLRDQEKFIKGLVRSSIPAVLGGAALGTLALRLNKEYHKNKLKEYIQDREFMIK